MSRPKKITIYRPAYFSIITLLFVSLTCSLIANVAFSILAPENTSVLVYYTFWPFFVTLLLGWIAYVLGTRRAFNQRDRDYAELTKQQYVVFPEQQAKTELSGIALCRLRNGRRPVFMRSLQNDNWHYSDYRISIYKDMQYQHVHYADVFYSVMSTDLGRVLPNVFFDSLVARGRQFRLQFANTQRHSLEGDFDKHFATYFPESYTIDSMSFISPEVMWALRDASDYDIEIINDRLYLYGPLWSLPEQLAEMEKHILEIKAQIIKNVKTYRDERLPFELGKQMVATQAISLKPSRFWFYVSTTITLVSIIGFFILLFSNFFSVK
ncbi:hypothetical protein KA047_01000 [Candidatus Saccharibacteria bacterium]|nr:hypothetical protein [Candidatus Saccharibacteria bacterium]